MRRSTRNNPMTAFIVRQDTFPRDATRGGVNGPALPVQRGRESPLSIDAALDED